VKCSLSILVAIAVLVSAPLALGATNTNRDWVISDVPYLPCNATHLPRCTFIVQVGTNNPIGVLVVDPVQWNPFCGYLVFNNGTQQWECAGASLGYNASLVTTVQSNRTVRVWATQACPTGGGLHRSQTITTTEDGVVNTNYLFADLHIANDTGCQPATPQEREVVLLSD
jgi:hypothetical protein